MTVLIGIALLVGQLVFTRFVVRRELARGTIIVLAIMALTAIVV
jgi:hypothetical protein